MTKLQGIFIGSSVVLFSVLYFGFNIKPAEHLKVEQKREISMEHTDVQSLIRNAQKDLSEETFQTLSTLEKQLHLLDDADTMKVGLLKELSSIWYHEKQSAIAGYYAEEVADIKQNAEAWSIAGATYFSGIQQSKEKKVQSFSTDKAIKSFENAISLAPKDITHQINLALCYTENPPSDEPMKGVQMLLSLDKKHPDNAKVLTNLGKLGIKTGQFEKAIGRLEKAVSIDPNSLKANCFLAEAYEKIGNQSKAIQYTERCRALANKE